MQSYSRFLCLALLGSALVGCAKKEGPAPSASASASASAELSKPPADADLATHFAYIAKTCKVDAKTGNVRCPKGETRTLIAEFTSEKRSRAESIGAFAKLLKDPNVDIQTVAASILQAAFRTSWGSKVKPGDVKPEDAEALIAAAVSLPPVLRREAMPAAVHSAMLSGRADALYAAIDKANDTDLRATTARYLMTHGRLGAFPKVQELAKNENQAVALAALESPRSMVDWQPEEQTAVCPWAVELLADSRAPVAAKAASLLANCGGEFVDKLLESGETALKAGKFSTQQVSAFRDLCSQARRMKKTGATEEQCKRNRKLLEKVVDSKTLDPQTRGMALLALSYQWPDDDTRKLAQRYEKSDDKVLSEHARRAAQRMDPRSAVAGLKRLPPLGSGRTPPGLPGSPRAPEGAPKPAAPNPAAPATP